MPAFPASDQVTALAPDAASLKAGRELSAPRKWTLLGADDTALWGLAQGSGKEPYQTRVALDGLATKCSCPSRKFPCKHALGLMFIAAQAPAALADKSRPEWVEEWLRSRAERVEKTLARVEAKAAAPVDEAAQAKRQEKRAGRVDDGVAVLEQWLADTVRAGLADPAATNVAQWEEIARRMIDAQAPGLARRVRLAAETVRSGDGWEARVADQLGQLHALLRAHRRRENLDADLRSEVEQLVGWTVPLEDVLAGPPLRDRWLVLARTVQDQDNVVVTQTWLRGEGAGRWAVLLRAAPAMQQVSDPWTPGLILDGELCHYPGAVPQRAAVRGAPVVVPAAQAPEGSLPVETFGAFLQRYAAGLAVNPWRRRVPLVARARPGALAGRAVLVDEPGQALPLRADDATLRLLHALCGGATRVIVALWDGDRLEPLTLVDDGEWITLTRQTALR